MELSQLYLFSGELIIALMTALWLLSLAILTCLALAHLVNPLTAAVAGGVVALLVVIGNLRRMLSDAP